MTRKIMLAVGVAISVFCLYLAFRGLSFGQILGALKAADLRWIAFAMVLYAGDYGLRSCRWEVLLSPVKRISPVALFGPLVIGFFANNVLPFRMGELIRAHVAGKKFHISRTATLGTIVIERIFDTISFLSAFLIVTCLFPFPSGIKKGAYVLGAGCVTTIGVLMLALHYQHIAHQLIEKLPLPLKLKAKTRELITNFSQGLSGLKRGSYVVSVLAYSIAIWTIEGTVLYLIAHAFPIGLTYPQAFFVMFFLGLSVTLPQAPGYVGTLELFGVAALAILGIPKEQGLPVILAVHGSQFLFILTLGLGALWKEGLSFQKILSPGLVSGE